MLAHPQVQEQRGPSWPSAHKALVSRLLAQREKKVAPARTDSDEILGIRDVATLLKIKTVALRALLSKITHKAPGQRYAWKASDPSLRSVPALIKAEAARKHGRVAASRHAA